MRRSSSSVVVQPTLAASALALALGCGSGSLVLDGTGTGLSSSTSGHHATDHERGGRPDQGAPDLVVERVRFHQDRVFSDGCNVQVTATIRNVGGPADAASFVVRGAATESTGYVSLLEAILTHEGAIRANQVWHCQPFGVNVGEGYDHAPTVIVDSDDELVEADETNNVHVEPEPDCR